MGRGGARLRSPDSRRRGPGGCAAIAGRAVESIDLDGACLHPAFNDNHTHPISFGESLSQVDASPRAVQRLDEILDAYRARHREQPGTAGWKVAATTTRLDIQRHPTRDELDTVTADRPMLLVRTCGHLGVANTAALIAAGIDDTTPDPQGGKSIATRTAAPPDCCARRRSSLSSTSFPGRP